ncbi:MAG TPA: hypothetical protein VMI15_05050 [Burkholderiales bacterium]|nr:hypothetical protein [Burkholderiales bacterium]
MRALVTIVLLLAASGAAAQPHSVVECREGGDFIRNAALARDNGVTREAFVGRLEQDLVAIRAFAPELRWFVHDPEDEQFLRAEVEAVFDSPLPAEEHRAGFIARCAAAAHLPIRSS